MGAISNWVTKHRASAPTVDAVLSLPLRASRDPSYAAPEDYERPPRVDASAVGLRAWVG